MCITIFFNVQIIHFLRTRAHPVMLKQVHQTNPFFWPNSIISDWLTIYWSLVSSSSISVSQIPVLPPTITDQIRLWELERDRLQFTEGEHVFTKCFYKFVKHKYCFQISIAPWIVLFDHVFYWWHIIQYQGRRGQNFIYPGRLHT